MQMSATRKGQRIRAMLGGELDHHSAQYVRAVVVEFARKHSLNPLPFAGGVNLHF